MTQSDYMINNPTETVFEDVIAAHLASSPLYNLRTSADFDINRMCDPVMLRQFIEEGQPETWAKLSRRFGTEALDQVIREYNRQVDNNGMLKTLRDGFTLQGIKIKLLQFKPDQKRNTPFVALYNKNCFSVVRQMRYSTAAKDKGNELDLAILINGIPFITCELKNEGTGQNIVNGMEQYRNHRDPNNRMLKSCLVHFVADNNRVMMTTKLCGENTMFLPFNINTDNPIIEGKYATSYMWEDIFQADSLLNIIQDFIKQYIPRKSKTRERVTIFPRYHQLRCVRRIIADIKEKGNGESYLVQHSAGSGKSKSIAWLAHQLSDLFDVEDKPSFDSIIVVTDRIILDKAIADEIEDFATVAGVVKAVKSGSSKLATALENGNRIIITTIQKFANVRKHLGELKGKRFAVIIDEAHSSQNGENAKDVKITLTDKELLQTIVEENDAEIENDTDRLLAEIQAARGQMDHISYFAFTATPKKQTLALFGHNGEAFDIYSMRQDDFPAIRMEAERLRDRYMEGYPDYELLYRDQPDTYFVAAQRYSANNPPAVKQAVRQYIITLIILLIVPAVNLSGLTLSRMRKRLSEIGVRKAFGAPRRELMIQVLSENMLYSLLGGVLGLILSYGATFFLGSMLFSIDFMGNGVTDLRTMCMDLLFDPVVFLLAFFACFALNLLSAAIPAWRVTRTNIVDAINER